MPRIGDTVRPELGRTDYSGYLRGAQQGAAAMGQGIAAAGKGIGDYLKQQKETEKEAVEAGKFLSEVGKMYEGTPLGERATMLGTQALDPGNNLADRHAAGVAGRDAVGLGLNKMLVDAEQGFKERQTFLNEQATRHGMGISETHAKINQQNADTNQATAAAEQADKEGAYSAAQLLAQYDKTGSVSGSQIEAFAPKNPDALPAYMGMTGQGISERQAAGVEKPLSVRDQIAVEKHEQEKRDAAITQAAGVESTNQFIVGMENLKNHEGFSGLFGAGWGTSRIPATKARDARVLFDQLDAKGFMKSIQSMKGMGALSNAEGEKASIAFNGLHPSMSEEAATERIEEVIRILKKGMKEAARINSGGALQGGQMSGDEVPQLAAEEMTDGQLLKMPPPGQKKSEPGMRGSPAPEGDAGPPGARNDVPPQPKPYSVFSGTRDQVKSFSSTPSNRFVSLDFNDADNKSARGIEIKVPDDATEEEIKRSEQWAKQTQAFLKKNGVNVPLRHGNGVKRGGRGKRGVFHTEPFFASNAAARNAIAKNGQEYASILGQTLGGISGVTFIAPHTQTDPGATSGGIGERDFAIKYIIPHL